MGRAAIVGAGTSGLTAAYRLQRAGWDAEVFEADDVVGGRVRTERESGYLIDTGAAGIASTYRSYRALAEELGVHVAPTAPFIGIRRDGRTHLLNMSKMVTSGAMTPLLSPMGKIRASRLVFDVARAWFSGRLDYADLSKAAAIDTKSARAYARRALTREIDSYLCEPIVRTMLIADTDKVSKVELFSGINNVFAAKFMATAGGQCRRRVLLQAGSGRGDRSDDEHDHVRHLRDPATAPVEGLTPHPSDTRLHNRSLVEVPKAAASWPRPWTPSFS